MVNFGGFPQGREHGADQRDELSTDPPVGSCACRHGRSTIRGMTPLQLIRIVAADQQGVVTAEQCRDAGIGRFTVQRLCRSRQWLRLSRGAYLVDAEDIREPPRIAVIRAAVLSAGPAAVAVLDTAAEVHGIAGMVRPSSVTARPGGPAFERVPPAAAVHVSLPGSAARARRVGEAGVRLHQFVLRPDEITTVNDVRVTTPTRTLADLLLRVDRLTAVALLDSALHGRFITTDDLVRIRDGMRGRRGAERAVPWLDLADGRAESPLETRVRLRAVDGGVEPDELQFRVVDTNGTVVAIADLAWTSHRIVGEADGHGAHDNPAAVFRDRSRQNAIVAAGFVPIRFTWADTLEPDTVPYLIRAAMNRAS
jgi:very-short-patch-repair endonuclease